MARITVFDTTLRDGEQSPGCSMTAPEKLRLAHELAELGVDVLEADLQDRVDNQTRFYLIARQAGALKSGPFKTACVAELENRPGVLHHLLGVFAARGLDLSHVASRPAASPWTYRFILEFGHATPAESEEAIAEARPLTARLKVLGTFPAWRADAPFQQHGA